MRKSKKSIEQDTIEAMQSLGTYKDEFLPLIAIYADLLVQYKKAQAQFTKEGSQYEAETASGGTKKSGTAAAMEQLRKDIITYSDRLGLNPKALDAMQIQPVKKSALAEAMAKLNL